MDSLKVKNFGPIKEADIKLGDLTLFVGPQASGKSILIQLLKLLEDRKNVRKVLEQYGYAWGNNVKETLDRYFGEGMNGIWNNKTEITFDSKKYTTNFLQFKQGDTFKGGEEHVFYIPAQRVICLQNGWPRFFSEYEDSVPYVLRHFSETLRLLLEGGLGKSKNDDDAIFPQSQRLKEPLRNSFDESIFHTGKIKLDKTGKKKLKLEIGDSSLPFMAWSAGQKEFMPLLLSFYFLCPSSKASRKEPIKYVVIEEPEMGLHPQAIKSVILQIIDLLSRDYKVIVSTHSPVLLEFAWAFQLLKQSKANEHALFELFELAKTPPTTRLFKGILEKQMNTYYFDMKKSQVDVMDISSLDAGSKNAAISEWGGLSSFAGKAGDIISKYFKDEE